MIDTILLNAIGSTPVTDIILVHDVDIDNINYKSGCQGQIKRIINYNAQLNIVQTTNLKYTDSTYPTKATRIEVI